MYTTLCAVTAVLPVALLEWAPPGDWCGVAAAVGAAADEAAFGETEVGATGATMDPPMASAGSPGGGDGAGRGCVFGELAMDAGAAAADEEEELNGLNMRNMRVTVFWRGAGAGATAGDAGTAAATAVDDAATAAAVEDAAVTEAASGETVAVAAGGDGSGPRLSVLLEAVKRGGLEVAEGTGATEAKEEEDEEEEEETRGGSVAVEEALKEITSGGGLMWPEACCATVATASR